MPPKTSRRVVSPRSIRRLDLLPVRAEGAVAGGLLALLVALGVLALGLLGDGVDLDDQLLELGEQLLLAAGGHAALAAAPWTRSSISWALPRIAVLASTKSWMAEVMVSMIV